MRPSEEILKLPLSERGRLAGEAAIEDVIRTHRQAGIPIAFLENGKVVELSADEYEARRRARALAKGAQVNGKQAQH